jgi:phosphoribosylformylglycinamidine synthase
MTTDAVNVLIPTGFGLNCEAETAHAFRLLGVEPDLVHLTDLFAGRAPRRLASYQVVVFIGGFSYGDHIAGGYVLATRLRARLREEIALFLERGGLALGICNGFQVLVRLGLLPGPDEGPADFVPRAALGPNQRLGYRDAWVRLAADPGSRCVWTRGLGTIEMPARHGEGLFLVEAAEQLDRLEEQGRIALRYVDPHGVSTEQWPWNPNGSPRGVAGVTDASGRILGLMPHPDAFLHSTQAVAGALARDGRDTLGLALFEAGLRAAAER